MDEIRDYRNKHNTRDLLIYIPCHTDFELALANVRKIRQQAAEITASRNERLLTINIAISINGTKLSKDELKAIRKKVDLLHYYEENIGGDSNITQGFMLALQNQPSYFWILSANEILKTKALAKVVKTIIDNPDADIIITNSKEREGEFNLQNVFLNLPEGLGLGLISGVIYNYPNMEFAFPAAAKFSWTGWGQLGVLQVACSKLGSLRVFEIPDSKVYEKPFTYLANIDNQLKQLSEFEAVRSNYQHSFFGMPIVVASLFSRNSAMRKKITSKWIKSNWYRINYFSKGVESSRYSSDPHFDTHWIRGISRPLFFKVNIFISILAALGMYLQIEKLKNIKVLREFLGGIRS